MDDYTTPPPPPPPPESVSTGEPSDTPPVPPASPGASTPMPPPYAGGPTVVQQDKGSTRRVLIIIAVVVLALCCCVTAAGGYAYWRFTQSPAFEVLESGGSLEESTGVAVWLEWEEPVDLELEIWQDEETFMLTAHNFIHEDIQDGADGYEYFEFGDYGGFDVSSGQYVVSVYFADLEPVQEEAFPTLTIEGPGGSTQTHMGIIGWDASMDQWHAFWIDAATGAITPIDEYQ